MSAPIHTHTCTCRTMSHRTNQVSSKPRTSVGASIINTLPAQLGPARNVTQRADNRLSSAQHAMLLSGRYGALPDVQDYPHRGATIWPGIYIYIYIYIYICIHIIYIYIYIYVYTYYIYIYIYTQTIVRKQACRFSPCRWS